MDPNLSLFLLYQPYFCSPQNFLPYMSLPMFEPQQIKAEVSVPAIPINQKYQRTWTKSELEEVFNSTIEYCQKYNKQIETLTISDFAVISMGKRQTPEQIMIKIKEVRANGTLRPGKWSEAEDSLLTSLVQLHQSSWGRIAQVLNNEIHSKLNIRNSKTCKERWNNYLNPGINRASWTVSEDSLLLKGYLQYGNKWKSITKILPNRIEGAIKNRIKSLLHKMKRECKSEEELMKEIDNFCNEAEVKKQENI